MVTKAAKRSFSKYRQKSTFYFFAVGSGLITSLWVVLDAIGNSYITDPYLFGAFEMVIGLVVSIILLILFHLPLPKRQDSKFRRLLGYYFDPDFEGLMFPKKKALLYTTLAGFFATGNTVLYFVLIKMYDASVIMPFSQFVLVYLLLADSISEKEKPVIVEIQALAMIAFGVIISTVSEGSLDPIGLLLIFGPFSIFSAAYTFFQKKALTYKNEENKTLDTLSLRIWTLIIMTMGQVIIAIPQLIREEGRISLINNWKSALGPVIGSMLLVYLGVILYTRALKMGKMSIVRSLNSVSVIATIPLAALFSIWYPEIFRPESSDLISIILKISGSILILIGIISLALSETRSIMLVRLKQGEPLELEKLSKIKGVESVAFVSGVYDLIVYIRLRNIGKAYNIIRKSISKLPWIEDVITLPLMKEYA